MFQRYIRKCLVAACMLFSMAMYGQGLNPEYRQTFFGKNGQLSANASLYVYDANYQAYKNTTGAIEKTWYIKNAVRFMIDEEAPGYIASDFSATIKLNIVSENAAGASTTHPQQTLTINYKKAEGQVSGYMKSYEFRDAVKVTVTIAEEITGDVNWDVKPFLKLTNEIVSVRDWKFDCTAQIGSLSGVADSLLYDAWLVQWTAPSLPASFASEYDLEWTWIDENNIAAYMVNGTIDLPGVFDNNATRISTAERKYWMPLLYEGEGRIYVRVRQAQQKVNGQRVEGSWYYLSHNGLAYLPRTATDGHEEALNWQSTTTYAEEGKRKTVVQYFDGTLRGRQTVTKDNVARTTVVAESFYDYQGRPVIQVLPSPTLNTIIQFTKNLNQFDDTRAFKTIYDKLEPGQSSCDRLTAKMLSTATNSAAQYYSANNPLAANGFNTFIPDAEGYPFTETRYTNDGTGRIDMQGGVGPLFQVNRAQATRYYYESVDQEDIDALFGTDAGYASHYTKNWVRDANGQYSVSYVDMKGKTVATALAGNVPANLQSLPSYANAGKTITRQLIDPETNNVNGNSITSSKSLIVPKQGIYQFDYSLSPEKLEMLLCNNNQYCFDCLYELNISIIPDCTDQTITYATSPATTFTNPVLKRNFTLGEYLASCSTNTASLSTSFSVTLPEGAYTIVKELKLSTAARDWYRENIYFANDTCKTKASFILQQYQLALAQQSCYATCAECETALGTETAFIQKFKTASGYSTEQINNILPELKLAYAEAKANCEALCDEEGSTNNYTELTAIKEAMLQDMMPSSGQYARTGGDNTAIRPFNIFGPARDNYCAATITRPYLGPVKYDAATQTVTCGDGYQNTTGQTTLTASQLSNLDPEKFSDVFTESYALNLLPYHPEFPKLKYAEANLVSSYQFVGKLQNIDTWSQANSQGFLHTSTTSSTIAAGYFMQKDPFFVRLGSSHPLYIKMRDAIAANYIAANPSCGLNNSLGMWQLARYTAFCSKEIRENPASAGGVCTTPTPALQACLSGQNSLPPANDGAHCAADMDLAWRNFRGMYLSFRDYLLSKYLTDETAGTMSSRYSIFETNSGNNYQERFVRYEDVFPHRPKNLGELATLLDNPAATFNQAVQDVCKSSTANWMQRLQNCPAIEAMAQNNPAQWASDAAWLSKYLVKICTPGVDYMGHPFGASSLPDNTGSIALLEDPDNTPLNGISVRSFPELIEYYLGFRQIAVSERCYPELIDYPKAYNVAPAIYTATTTTVPEACVCERISYFYVQWQNAGAPGTFKNYLFNTQGTTISQEDLNTLMAMCSTGYTSQNPDCNTLVKPVTIPAIFQCRGTADPSSSKTCITCGEYDDLKAAFINLRGLSVPFTDPQTETEINWNKAFANFINYRTGFNKHWTEYVQFEQQCANTTIMSCDMLTDLVAAWQATNPPQQGDACRQSFVQYMNEQTHRYLTFNQWMNEFIQSCGSKPPVCQPVLTCQRLDELVKAYYENYGYQVWRNSNCQQLFVDFVNQALGSNYTWSDIVSNYNQLCAGLANCVLDVCSFPNSQLLTILYYKYKDEAYNAGWTPTQCQDNFTAWFNQQTGFTATPYTWSGIRDLYMQYRGRESCVPNIDLLCTPPYTCNQLTYVLNTFQSQQPAGQTAQECAAAFVSYFNSQFNKNYSYQEIINIYTAVCGSAPAVCTGGQAWDCFERLVFFQQTIENFASSSGPSAFCSWFEATFNSNYNTNYTYEEIDELYQQHCGVRLPSCDFAEKVFNCSMLQNALHEFSQKYPGGYPLNCEAFFAGWFNTKFGTLYLYTDIADLYMVQCGQELTICASKCPEYHAFTDNFSDNYGNLRVPLAGRRQVFEKLFNTQFGYTGSGANAPLMYSQVKELIGGCTDMPGSLENENGHLSLEDEQVLLDLKKVYYLRHPEGLPANCSDDFTSWVNWLMGTDKTWCELVAMYNDIVGEGSADMCGESDCVAVVGGFSDPGGGIFIDELEDPGDMNAGGLGTVEQPVYGPMLCGLNEVLLDTPPADTSSCDDPLIPAITDGQTKWQLYIDSLRNHFDVTWYKKCTNAKTLESFTVTFQRAEHHYTLYYYDQAGQLVRTVPPEGVEDKRGDNAFLANVKTARQQPAVQPVRPQHTLATDYRYNTLGQVVQQKSPDGGLSQFWYDYLGRLVVSQNAEQAKTNRYSYTLYDELGRITEVGQKQQAQTMTQAISRSSTQFNTWVHGTGTASKEQVTRTVYDKSYFDGDDLLKPEQLTQRNLRNRVSYTQVFDVVALSGASAYAGTHRAATYYTYDIHGNVDTLLQDYGNSTVAANIMNQSGSRYKKIAYNYDLVSGKVNMVSYQPGYVNVLTGEWISNADRFYHKYYYDAENRLTEVYTSHDSLVWERDAAYSYYKHGPLARTVLGQQQVQGVDYAYTTQGWMKGVNSSAVGDGAFDMGGDGMIGGARKLVARDAYGFSLNYYRATLNGNTVNDYKSINNAVTPFVSNVFTLTNTDGATIANPLFNGNIAAMLINVPKLGNAQLYGYGYDQLNRIVSMDAFTGMDNAGNSFTAAATASYKERVTYDANGNIKTYLRNGKDATGQPLAMDNLSYGYNKDANGKLANNKLRHVKDAVGDANYTIDIDNQGDDNYDYDAIGNLVRDNKEGISNITWSVYGKILSIAKNGNLIKYTYDASGNRISKTAGGRTTWYVRDASGNVMAVYEQRSDLNSGHLTQSEVHLYGSSRLGVYNINRDMTVTSGNVATFERGHKFFELSNHLGNVLVTVSDRKLQVQYSTTGTIHYYTADVVNAVDYYPFGMEMPGRKYSPSASSGLYRYGFNGKERDTDMNSLTAYDYGFRIYNPAIGKFLSVDPLAKSFPWYTPYQFAGNKPIYAIDLDGLEECPYHKSSYYKKNEKGEVVFEMLSDEDWDKEMDRANRSEQGYRVPEKDAAWTTKFSMGFTNTLLSTIGFVSEMPAQAHYGDKIKPENKNSVFPVTGDGNIGRLFAEGITAPFYLLKEIINNPDDPEKWGELAGSIFVMRKVGSARTFASLLSKRVNLANDFYQKQGYSPKRTISHLEGIDFVKPVQTTTLKKGTVIQQWVGENGVGDYFTSLENGAKQNLGVPDGYGNRTLKQFVLSKDVKVLKSTAADYKGQAGGGVQYFSAELKYNVTPKQ